MDRADFFLVMIQNISAVDPGPAGVFFAVLVDIFPDSGDHGRKWADDIDTRLWIFGKRNFQKFADLPGLGLYKVILISLFLALYIDPLRFLINKPCGLLRFGRPCLLLHDPVIRDFVGNVVHRGNASPVDQQRTAYPLRVVRTVVQICTKPVQSVGKCLHGQRLFLIGLERRILVCLPKQDQVIGDHRLHLFRISHNDRPPASIKRPQSHLRLCLPRFIHDQRTDHPGLCDVLEQPSHRSKRGGQYGHQQEQGLKKGGHDKLFVLLMEQDPFVLIPHPQSPIMR